MPDDEYTDDYEEYSEDYVYVEDDGDYAQPRTSGAVVFLGIAAAICTVIFLLVLGASFLLPSLKQTSRETAEDPDSMLHGLRLEEEPVLKDKTIFAVDLYEAGLGEKIEGMFVELIAGKGAVRNTLKKYVG